ncbi:MAG: hypothetical protein K2M27_08305 [Muribaculaceae bacterium]|nr:hypothetical protein [Muribaculaceae bacterium]
MNFYHIILLIFILCGCGSSNKDLDYIQTLYSDRNIVFDDETEFCIVLPEVGCSGCISGILYDVLDNKASFSNNQKKNLIVFTAVNSKKMLRRNIQVDSLDELNCIVDTENRFLLDTKDKIYPIIMTLDNGRITNVMIQSPDNPEDAFAILFDDDEKSDSI